MAEQELKSLDKVLEIASQRLDVILECELAGATEQLIEWPLKMPLGEPSNALIASGSAAFEYWRHGWLGWAELMEAQKQKQSQSPGSADQQAWPSLGVSERRLAGGAGGPGGGGKPAQAPVVRVPNHVKLPNALSLAKLVDRVPEFNKAQSRGATLRNLGVQTVRLAENSEMLLAMTGQRFHQLSLALEWAASSAGRQVLSSGRPLGRSVMIPGVDTKWLERHSDLLGMLTGRSIVLEKVVQRPLELKHLDPAIRASGGRELDGVFAGEMPLVLPQEVLLVENKQPMTSLWNMPGCAVLFAAGEGIASRLAEHQWLMTRRRIFYWGDMDTAGFEILNSLRAAFPGEVISLGMDLESYERWLDAGVDAGSDGRFVSREGRVLSSLTADEQAAYGRITGQGTGDKARIEQERIDPAWLRDRWIALLAAEEAAQGPVEPVGPADPAGSVEPVLEAETEPEPEAA